MNVIVKTDFANVSSKNNFLSHSSACIFMKSFSSGKPRILRGAIIEDTR